MSNIEYLIKEIKKNKELAEMKIEEVNPQRYTTQLGKIKRAKENLKSLYESYRNEVKQNTVFIVLKGKQGKSFIDIATGENYGCFEINADKLYEDIASKVNSRYYQDQTSSPTLFDILMSSFEDICDDLGIIGYPAVLFESKYQRRLKSKEDLIELTKEAFNEKVGSELVGLYAVDKVARKAVNEDYEGKSIPIIIHSKDNKLIDELSVTLNNVSRNVFKISTTKKQSKKLVEEKLLEISKNIVK